MAYRVNRWLEVIRDALAKLKSISSHMGPDKTDFPKSCMAAEDPVGNIVSLGDIHKMSQKRSWAPRKFCVR